MREVPKKTPFAVPKTAVASCGFELDWRKESRKVMSLQSPVALPALPGHDERRRRRSGQIPFRSGGFLRRSVI